MSAIKKHWQLIFGLAIFWMLVAGLFAWSTSRTQGHLIYFVDDPYIHMAIAKNVALHGVWGVNKYGFTSSSSSPLWTSIVALSYLLFGVNELFPFVINLIVGTFLIFCVYLLLKKYGLKPLLLFGTLLAVIFFTPLPPLIFFGLEHTLQILLDILFVYLAAKILSDEKPASKDYIFLLILAPFVTAARYEGIFLVFVVCALLYWRKGFLHALGIGVMAALPVTIYGVISLSEGWFFLPNSVLLKGYLPKLTSLAGLKELAGYYEAVFSKSYHIIFLILISLACLIFLYGGQDKKWSSAKIWNVVFIATALLHLQFARSSIRGIRYDAYLVALGVFAVSIGAYKYFAGRASVKTQGNSSPRYFAIAVLVLILIFPIAWRALRSFVNTPKAAKNTYEQQYQMGRFFREFYQGESIAVNDIGVVNFLADTRSTDLWGLADLEVATLRREGRYSIQEIYEMTKRRGVKVAIVYDNWFGAMPDEWVKVGTWTIVNNVVCGGDTVSFYAVDPNETSNLIANLKFFAPKLPKDVIQGGEYVK